MTVIVVSGAPGTGKSTVAAALADGLRWPLLSLDPVKEAVADVLGLGDGHGIGREDWSNRVGDTAAEIVFRLSAQFPDAVAEGWWRGDRRERALAEFAGAIEVFCHCDPQLALSRMRARHGTGHDRTGQQATGQPERARHPIHRDVINPAVLERAAMLAATVTPLGLGSALIRVDTEQPDAPACALAEVAVVLGRDRAEPGPGRADRTEPTERDLTGTGLTGTEPGPS